MPLARPTPAARLPAAVPPVPRYLVGRRGMTSAPACCKIAMKPRISAYDERARIWSTTALDPTACTAFPRLLPGGREQATAMQRPAYVMAGRDDQQSAWSHQIVVREAFRPIGREGIAITSCRATRFPSPSRRAPANNDRTCGGKILEQMEDRGRLRPYQPQHTAAARANSVCPVRHPGAEDGRRWPAYSLGASAPALSGPALRLHRRGYK